MNMQSIQILSSQIWEGSYFPFLVIIPIWLSLHSHYMFPLIFLFFMLLVPAIALIITFAKAINDLL